MASSERADLATGLMMTMLGLYREYTRHLPSGASGRFGTRLAGLEETPQLMAVPLLVAIAEEFSLGLLMDRVERELPPHTELGKKMLGEAEGQAERSWHDQEERWRRWFGVSIPSFPEYANFKAYVDMRNAIVHGLGYLTRKQMRTDGGAKVVSSLQRIGVPVSDGRLFITPATVEEVANTCRTFILWLDAEAAA